MGGNLRPGYIGRYRKTRAFLPLSKLIPIKASDCIEQSTSVPYYVSNGYIVYNMENSRYMYNFFGY